MKKWILTKYREMADGVVDLCKRILTKLSAAWEFVKAFSRRHSRVIMLAIVNAVVVLVLSYLLNSIKYTFGNDLTIGQWVECAKSLKDKTEAVPDSICLVNVAYDKSLMKYEALIDRLETFEYRDDVGHAAVTDRAKLLAFLNALDSVEYRYIMMDIRFENGFEKDSVSSALFRKISQMDRIVIAKHSNYQIADDNLENKAALGDYYTTFLVSTLVKYPTVNNDNSTIPGRMYEEQCGHKIKSHGLWWSDNGRLCYGSIFLTYPVRVTKWQQAIAGESEEETKYLPLYSNLGHDILNSEIDFKEKFTNKIIVIGDFVEDVHETYVGRLPGAIVNLNVYLALVNGNHLVNWWWAIFLGLVYFAICLAIFKRTTIFNYVSFVRDTKSTTLRFVISLLGYSTLLSTIACCYYVFGDRFYSIVFPALYFSILSAIVRYRYMKNNL